MNVHQGQRYAMGEDTYMAMENGNRTVLVAKIDPDRPWPLSVPILAHVSQLTPLPVRRYHGEVR